MCRIYVKRNEYQRFDTLYQAFRTSIPGADVLWDRRTRDRRKGTAPAEVVDRRWSDRRITPPDSWHALGFVVTHSSPSDNRTRPAAARRPASPPRLLTHGLVEPSVAELKGTFVRIAENLVGEIVRRLKNPPAGQRGPSPQGPVSLSKGPDSSSVEQPTSAPPPSPPSPARETTWKLIWPPSAERN